LGRRTRLSPSVGAGGGFWPPRAGRTRPRLCQVPDYAVLAAPPWCCLGSDLTLGFRGALFRQRGREVKKQAYLELVASKEPCDWRRHSHSRRRHRTSRRRQRGAEGWTRSREERRGGVNARSETGRRTRASYDRPRFLHLSSRFSYFRITRQQGWKLELRHLI
jgi:hypothetical protein